MKVGKTRVFFVIPSLGAGGAERQLCELVRSMDRERFTIHVAVFYDRGYYDGGELWPEISALPAVELHPLHKRIGVFGYLTALPRLLALLLRVRPEILHGYLGGNLPVFLFGSLLRIPFVWGIRRTSRDLSKIDNLSQWLMGVMARLSRFVDLIIFNSEAGLRNHEALHFQARRMQVIPNGIDTRRFVPDFMAGIARRQAWGIPDHMPLIGIVGRLHPVKDHPTFLRAAARIARDWPEVRFVCVGEGAAPYAESLVMLATTLGIADRITWAGICTDMVSAYNALTLLVVSSTDEGFPNVLGEAMACGIPCISTRVGDAAAIVGDAGLVVDVGDDAAIAEGASSMLKENTALRASRVQLARERICGRYSVAVLASKTEQALLALLDCH